MANFNRVILMGNLTRDPEIRYTPSGTAVGDLRMAVNRKYRTPDGQDREETCYVGVTVWRKQAETCGEYLRKGSPILVEGRLKYDEWEKEGQKQSRLSVVAERVQFLGSPRGAEFRDGRGRPPAEKKPPARQEEPPGDGPPPSDIAGDDDNLPF
jgi:single-strand DNA-binding protein